MMVRKGFIYLFLFMLFFGCISSSENVDQSTLHSSERSSLEEFSDEQNTTENVTEVIEPPAFLPTVEGVKFVEVENYSETFRLGIEGSPYIERITLNYIASHGEEKEQFIKKFEKILSSDYVILSKRKIKYDESKLNPIFYPISYLMKTLFKGEDIYEIRAVSKLCPKTCVGDCSFKEDCYCYYVNECPVLYVIVGDKSLTYSISCSNFSFDVLKGLYEERGEKIDEKDINSIVELNAVCFR